MSARAPHRPLPVVLFTAALALAGCSNPVGPGLALKRPPDVPVDAAPAADSPANLLMRFRWAWEHQDCTVYEDLFTEDYAFIFAAEDSTGNPPLVRDEELAICRHIFVTGTPDAPRANRITLTYASPLVAMPDRRPGKAYPWHQEVSVRVVLRIETDAQVFTAEGKAMFFVVRGDSARIPEALRRRGFGPDPGRWYIERWEDQTGAGGGALAAAPPAAVVPRRAGGMG